ncbi:MAG: outer membrane receptor for ferrienterochelin and colicin [Moritella dasanensis]|jgi:outer membrane receptor for ferrienterochelin and colicin
MNKKHINKITKMTRIAMVVAATFALSSQVEAQVTSSSLRGQVVDTQGNPVVGVTVEVVNTLTGSRKTLTTSENGVFQSSGLQVGGPYEVKLQEGAKYKAQTISDLFLQLGQTSNVALQASNNDSQVEVIQVTGRVSMAAAFKAGPGTEFTENDIINAPAISRDFKSLLKRDSKIIVDNTVDGGPALSVAGGNIRGNSLTVDGVKQNDDFGLNKNGYPGRRSPISLDAIQQISVNIAPIDVTYGGFQGANINIVTKSGTNDFHGSAFYFRSDDSLIGNKSEGQDLNIGDFEEDTYGFSLGGKIIEDKLFFFAAYEKFETTSPYQFSLDNLDGNIDANERRGVSQDDFERIAQVASDVWDYDIGGYNVPKEEEAENLLVKLDWYINDDHRASLTYQDNQGNTVRDFWAESFPGAATATAESNRFNQAETLEALSMQVFSDWTNDFSTEFKLSNKKVTTSQNPLLGANFSQFLIGTPNGGSLYIGPDQFRHANVLENERFGWKIKGDYYLTDEHKLTAGWEHEKLDIFNLFVFGSLGFAEFASIEDFADNKAVHVFQNALSGNALDAVDEFQYEQDVVYIQDKWNVNDDVVMTYGLRYTKYSNDDKPALNQGFANRHGYSNQGNFDGLDLIEPRIGVTYTYDDETVIRGGFGLFGGGGPNVWLSNSYGNDGVRKAFRVCASEQTGIPEQFVARCDADGKTTPTAVLDQLAAAVGNNNGDTNTVHPDFEIPSVWKLNVGIERNQDLGILGESWLLTADAIISEVNNAAFYRELNFEALGTAPDGRPIYGEEERFDLSLENTDKGGSQVWNFSAAKNFYTDHGTYNFNIGYTYQDVTEVNPGNSFIAFEGYGMPANSDFQAATEFNSEYEVRHSFTSNLTWSDEIFADNLTTVSVAYSARSGRHFSHTMRSTLSEFGGFTNSGFADWTGFSSQSLYIPTGADDALVTYADGFDQAGFFDYVNSESCLSDNAGTISRRHACASNWIHRIDLRLLQEIKITDDQAIEVILDLENIGNMLNDDWGRAESYNQPFNAPVVDVAIDGGQYVYSNFTQPVPAVAKIPSVWKVQLGVRYKF